tara:strand:+ start:73 stop:270 length:198 start_codon:yes stop_codon:yes gene_type:complete
MIDSQRRYLYVHQEMDKRLKKIKEYEKELNYYKGIRKDSKYRHIENHIYYLECKINRIKKLTLQL